MMIKRMGMMGMIMMRVRVMVMMGRRMVMTKG